ncbi:hypothetical protein L596_012699 [Steinernema carpocapsae]|uniref:DZF domain-containing protein n=1 Tax=Steinernema carpocapsae TaxID=34508 RepID=A0A4V6A4V5_STECR|nr:hypothetical protein L596_012699 [Steinernema carpocapsae]
MAASNAPQPKSDYFRPVPFDYYSCGPSAFPVVNQVDDFALSKILVESMAKHSLGEPDRKLVSSKLERVQAAISKLRETDSEIGEAILSGSFAKGTSLAEERTGEIVVMMKTIPAEAILAERVTKIADFLKEGGYVVTPQSYGCDVTFGNVVIRVKFAVNANMFKTHDPSVHMDKEVLACSLRSTRRANNFIARSKRSPLANFVRILLDIKTRFQGLEHLEEWHMELYAYQSLSGFTPSSQPVSLSQAFKRFFQLLAAGALLPGAPTLQDPVNIGNGPRTQLTDAYTYEQMDDICQAAQYISRLILMGRYYEVLGLAPLKADGMAFSQKAYNPEDDPTRT